MPHRRKKKTATKEAVENVEAPVTPRPMKPASVENTAVRTTMKMPTEAGPSKFDSVLSSLGGIAKTSGVFAGPTGPTATGAGAAKPAVDREALRAKLHKKMDLTRWKRTGMKSKDLEKIAPELTKPELSPMDKIISNPNLIRNHLFQYGTEALEKLRSGLSSVPESEDTMFIIHCPKAATDPVLKKLTKQESPRLELLIVRSKGVYYLNPCTQPHGVVAAIRDKKFEPTCNYDNVLECPEDAKWPLPTESYRVVADFDKVPLFTM